MQYTLHELLDKHLVTVPRIQRDYAQGRDKEIDLRKSFIRQIKSVLQPESPSLNLDFVYGYTEKVGDDTTAFIPLDGQQRLTTLWLLHWFVAPRCITETENLKEEVISAEAKKYLDAFTYQTRISSRRFCKALISNSLPHDLALMLSDKIKDAPWFMSSWQNDPTINSMLNMLDTIQEANIDTATAWDYLVKYRKITFDFIDIRSEEFKLTDELYIKMNSRGKPLTPFENFKAQFSGLLASKGTDYINARRTYENSELKYNEYFAFKIDSSWMDLVWSYREFVNNKVDNSFLNFIYFIAEFLYYKDNSNSSEAKQDFEFLNKVFSVKSNVDFLINSLDLLAELGNLEDFFSQLFTELSTFDGGKNDFFYRSITKEDFDVHDKTLFYAILHYCITTKTQKVDDNLKDFVRIVRNLLFTVRQPVQGRRIQYTTNLRLTNVAEYCKFIDELVRLVEADKQKTVYDLFELNEFSGFSKENISTEKVKANLIISNPSLKQSIFALEEHSQIKGNTACFNLNTSNAPEKINAFLAIWSGDTKNSLIIRAFLTTGDYSVKTHNYSSLGKIWYFGSPGYWNRILTTTDKDEKSNVSACLDDFLVAFTNVAGSSTDAKLQYLIDNYQAESDDWRYYFIKYDAITHNTYLDLNVFTWHDGKGFDINHLGNCGIQPLHSYHLNPYLIVLKLNFADDNEIFLRYGRFADRSSIIVKGDIRFECHNAGWMISTIGEASISSAIILRYGLTQIDTSYLLTESNELDKIEIATELIKELLSDV